MTATRIQQRDVVHAFTRFVNAAKRAGFQADNWIMQQGNPSAGQAWRVFDRDPETHGLAGLPMTNGEGWVGNTTREAYEILHHMAKTLDAVRELHEQL